MLFSASLVALIPLVFASPVKRAGGCPNSLTCIIQQYAPPFDATGLNGFIHLYANVTTFDSSTQTTSFTETRLGIAEDGTLQNCGDCRSTQQFAFEVCEGPDRKGFDGLGNSGNSFYGHILYTLDQTNLKCLTAKQPFNGSSITAEDCQYDYENAAASGQYFQVRIEDAGETVVLLDGVERGSTYGVNPVIEDGGKLTLWDGPPGAGANFTYLGFKAPQF